MGTMVNSRYSILGVLNTFLVTGFIGYTADAEILHDPQHPTYSISRFPFPRSPLISMLHAHGVMQDLGKPVF